MFPTKPWALWLTVFVLAVCSESTNGGRPQVVGVHRDRIEYVAAQQLRSNWCWAASLQMLLNYYDVDVDQVGLVARTKGSFPNGSLPNAGGSERDVMARLNGKIVDKRGRHYELISRFGAGIPPPRLLVDELSRRRPLLVGYVSGRDKKGGKIRHMVLVEAAEFSIEPSGKLVVHSMAIREPSPNLAKTKGRVIVPAKRFADSIDAYFTVRVRPIAPGK